MTLTNHSRRNEKQIFEYIVGLLLLHTVILQRDLIQKHFGYYPLLSKRLKYINTKAIATKQL